MNYADKLKDSRGRAAEGLLATKIIDLMDKLRLGDTENAARRWIWELLQNAKDVAYDDKPVSVVVEFNCLLENPTLVFKHNGQPFSSDNITSLIHQVSSKKRKVEPTVKRRPTGKFGTGFLSTHLLSEMVDVHGIVKEQGLPYKEFVITLDRSATESHEVLESVTKSLEAVNQLLNSEKEYSAFNPADHNTKFIYHLLNKKVSVAQAGIDDLHVSLPYTLAFTTEIAQVAVDHEGMMYEVSQRQKLNDDIEEICIIEDNGKDIDNVLRRIVVLSGEKAAIALEIYHEEGNIRIKPFSDTIPRLFCDFPLVGSHDFPFPVIINCSDFNINEPRNGVWLTNKDDKRVKENEQIMDEAVLLFGKLLNYAAKNKWMNLYEICKTGTSTQSEWLSKVWFDDTILKALRNYIIYTPIITIGTDKKAILDDFGDPIIHFPQGANNEIRENIWKLSQQIYLLPPFEEVQEWAKVIWKTRLLITLPVLAKEVEKTIDLNGLHVLLKHQVEPVKWLNDFYKTMNLDIVFEDEVIAGKFAVIANQSGTFLLRNDLKVDEEHSIQEEIKDVLNILGRNIRDQLLFTTAYTGTRVKYISSTEQNYIDEMNLLLTGNSITLEQKYSACDFLIALFPTDDQENIRRNKIYYFSKVIYEETVSEKKLIKHNADIWKEADKIQIKAIATTIADAKNLEHFSELYFSNDLKKALSFLNEFVEFLVANEMDGQLNVSNKPLLPNQHGIFKIKDAIHLDDGEIPEQLKIVAEIIGYDIKDLLLDKAIYLYLPEARTITADIVATEISSRIKPAALIHPRPENTKEACKLLLLYFIQYPEQSKAMFTDLYNHKHKLYDDEEIANNMKQAEDVKQIMEELNISSLDQLRGLLSRNFKTEDMPAQDVIEITTEILASWGVTTREEYDALIGSDVKGHNFRHYSIPTTMMFDHAQELIERAKVNIMKYLAQSDQYDTKYMELIAPTVLAGIVKGGINIHVVFRPGDKGEVLFYYPSEKAALDLDNAELWVDDGLNDPFHLTLGRILQTTGINRIPIYGIN
jgi:hypothetical protein